MAMICNKANCKACSCYRKDEEEDRMACWAKQDGKKIRDIILEVWRLNNIESLKCDGAKLEDFNIWVSYIMCYGFSPEKILEFAEIRGIKHNPHDCDPDDDDDHYGALELDEKIIAILKEEK